MATVSAPAKRAQRLRPAPLWLSLLLLWPGLGDLFAPLTYGRWMPLHMNWQLYGWTALPARRATF